MRRHGLRFLVCLLAMSLGAGCSCSGLHALWVERPVVDVPSPVCGSEVAWLLRGHAGQMQPSCPTAETPSVTYVRAAVAGHDVVSVAFEQCDVHTGEISCGDRRESLLFIDGRPADGDALASIGDLRALDAATQRALLLAALREFDCALGTDEASRAPLSRSLASYPVGMALDERGPVLRAVASCDARRLDRPIAPMLLRLEARPGSAGVETVREVLREAGHESSMEEVDWK